MSSLGVLAKHSYNTCVGLGIDLEGQKSGLDLAKIPMLNGVCASANALCRIIGNHLKILDEGLRLKLCHHKLIGIALGGVNLINSQGVLDVFLHNEGSGSYVFCALFVKVGKVNSTGNIFNAGINLYKARSLATVGQIVALGELSLRGISHYLLKLLSIETAIESALAGCRNYLAVIFDLCSDKGRNMRAVKAGNVISRNDDRYLTLKALGQRNIVNARIAQGLLCRTEMYQFLIKIHLIKA